ncbi:pentatricopeptide repeat-containing protein At2g37320 isoform X2 [Benincasa hispida]|uniref:pentatricopeptide repeat-containing protein At2g37320 isoform X2 n=1 Tax=Benincasa hispida TaxID=102211 RepID=UPI0019012C3F|nr:pentatricopeptide repeat-containing protein At2g37320 isoform X2 [Benincasa hispida]
MLLLRRANPLHGFHLVPSIRLFSNFKPKTQSSTNLPKPPKLLDLISPKGNFANENRQTHLRLIQDFLQTDSDQCRSQTLSDGFDSHSIVPSKDSSSVLYQERESGHWDLQLFAGRFKFDANDISSVLSLCSSQLNLRGGIQYHSVAIRTGFIANVYVGSSLVSLYGKCGELSNAYQVFEEMPVRNVVSWTAIISGFAVEWHVDMCLKLFQQMKRMALQPNEFTFATILSACTGSGALGLGRSLHCQTFKMGFDSYLHVANALISMYCKCGALNFALYIFEAMEVKDIVSWNSMIAGYAQHGLSLQAIDLYITMRKQKQVEADAITFLGVLSSCRHAGLVEEGKYYFNLMVELGVKPELDHYACVIDLLGRAGLLKEAQNFIEEMPISPNSIVWGSLLSACRLHGNVWIGLKAAESRLLLQPDCASTHLQMANLYAKAGYLNDAARLRKMMKDKGLKTTPGYSWIEIQNKVYRFKAEDKSNPVMVEILGLMDGIMNHMRFIGYFHEVEDEVDDIFLATS